MSPQHVVVVGAGHAGGTFAAHLRQAGFDGAITLVGHESHLPYHRPPLSKSLASAPNLDLLRPAESYDDLRIDTLLGRTVVSVIPDARQIELDSGEALRYDTLVLATGAAPRQLDLPGSSAGGIHTLRTLEDARRLQECLHDGGRLAIVGGGYVGLEIAAAARGVGVDVALLEREDRLLARVASASFSAHLATHHRAAGTTVRTAVGVTGFREECGRVAAVTLADGDEIPCSAVLVGVGALPRDAIARAAGLECEGGIVVDESTRTSREGILAIGDVTRRPVQGAPTSDGRMRLESIPGATNQAKRAAAVVLGSPLPPEEVPWFWSDQFDLKIKIAGIVPAAPTKTVERRLPTGGYALFHCEGKRVVAAETINSPREFMAAKSLIAQGRVIDVEDLADPCADLRGVVAA